MSLYTLEQVILGVWESEAMLAQVAPLIDVKQNREPGHVINLTQTVAADVDIRLDAYAEGQEVTVEFVCLTFDQAVTYWLGQQGSGSEAPGASSAIDVPAPSSNLALAINHATFTRSSTRGLWLRTTAQTEVKGFMVLT